MCGISALVSADPRPLSGPLRRMTDAIRHRGPDDEGYALFRGADVIGVFGGPDTPDAALRADLPFAPAREPEVAPPATVALGHRRLAIVDLSPAGHQPMCYGDRRYWIAYNGEVYNHPELRAELEALGHRFLSATDTEVVLAAYAEWGEACTQRFNGMWSFVIHDRVERTVFASRDRFGIKPLYYWTAPDGTLAIASEIKQLTRLDGWRARINGPRLFEFLAWATFDHTDETMFAGVRQLRGGHRLLARVADGRVATDVRPWYSLGCEGHAADMDGAAARTRELLAESVRLRLRADVKVGSCLSGGIDSSSIVCLVNRELAAQERTELQETVSSCSEIDEFDERRFIEAVRERTKTRAHYVFPDPDRLVDDLARIVWHQDEPFSGTSVFAQWCVFAEARRNGLIVMLDGQGADELFAGYKTAYAPWIAELIASRRWRDLARNVRLARELHGYKLRRLALTPVRQLLPTALRQSTAGWTSRKGWIRAAALRDGGGGGPRRLVSPGRSLAEWSLDQLQTSNLPMLLHYEDRNSMAHSVESRVPFLDHRLVEYVLGLPGELKLHDGTTKAVLRESMRDVLPDAIRERRDKMAFVTPERVWFREQSQRFRPFLERACEVAPEVFDRRAVMHLAEATALGRRRGHSELWRVLCTGAWMERFELG